MSDAIELLKGKGKIRYMLGNNITDEQMNKTSGLIRRMVVGTIIAEYALMELQDQTKQELKMKTNIAIKSIRSVQDWFLNHPMAGEKYRNIFKKEFLKGQLILMGDLIETVWGLSEEDLEDIISQLKNAMNGTGNIEAENNTANNG